MFNMNKKGVSEVVQVVLIMALSILAIATVSKYVLTLSGNLESQLSPTVDCLTMKSKVVSACYNQNNKIELKVVTKDEENPSLKISTGEDVFICNANSCSTCQLSEGTKTIYLNPSNSPINLEGLTYQFGSCSSQTIGVTACVTP